MVVMDKYNAHKYDILVHFLPSLFLSTQNEVTGRFIPPSPWKTLMNSLWRIVPSLTGDGE